MKKLLLFAICLVGMSSCYNTKILVGNVTEKTPVVEIATVSNHHIVYGLVPLDNATLKADEYLEGRKDYVIKTHQTVINVLVNWLTFGIYTPTQTTFYIPLKDARN